MKHYIYLVYNTADITTHGNTKAIIKIGETANPEQRTGIGSGDIRHTFRVHGSELYHSKGLCTYAFEDNTACRLALLMESNLRKSIIDICASAQFIDGKNDYLIINTADLRRIVEGFATLGAMVERDSREPSLASLFF